VAATVTITSPANGATVTGVVTVAASISPTTGFKNAALLVDDVQKQTDSALPISFQLDTRGLTNGSHVVKVTVTVKPNVQSSAQIMVTVSNTLPTQIEVASYGFTDSAIRAAIADAQADRVALHFAGGHTYVYDNVLTFDSIDVFGDGDTSILQPSRPDLMALHLVGTNPKLRSLLVTCPTIASRLTTPQSTGVWVDHASGFLVDRVHVNKAGSAGIFNYGGQNGVISNNHVQNTLADGIHNTNGAALCDVFANLCEDVGDDMFAIISYQSQGVRCHDITIRDNTGSRQPWGRGIGIAGPYNCHVLRNHVDHTYGAGILCASETASLTYGTDDIEVDSNVIRFPDQGNIHNCNIRVSGAEANFPVNNIYGANNDCDRAKQILRADGAISAITVAGFFGN
jgi:hypothetical protein